MFWLKYIIGDAAFVSLRAYLVSRSTCTRKIISVRIMCGVKGNRRNTKIGFKSYWNPNNYLGIKTE